MVQRTHLYLDLEEWHVDRPQDKCEYSNNDHICIQNTMEVVLEEGQLENIFPIILS